MSVYWSALAHDLSPYVPGEQPKDRKLIKLNTNENPYPPSPKVLDAINKAANESLRLYPDPACTLLREAVAKRWGIKHEQVFAGNGSDEILAFAFAAFFNRRGSIGTENKGKDGPLLFPDITYSFYPVYAALWDIPYENPELAGDFSIDPDDYKQKSGGVILPNPNAPTGKALGIHALKDIAAALEKNKKVFIIDEAYIEFANENGTGSMVPFINDHPNVLVIRTLSKDASLAGLRAGYAAGSEELIEGLCRLRDSFNSYTVDRIAQAAAAAAISDTSYYNEINRRIILTRDRTTEALRDMGFRVIPSQANFIFASPPAAGQTAVPFTAAAMLASLRDEGILVRHFNKPKIDNYLRISIGTDEEMDTLLKVCKKLTGRGS